jgi:DNA-directed RNA polymerase subunit M|tara:strand:+ start:1144 stop:1464 length:321 start_codon:yes stop_codon:yes gene_type:complete
MKFCPKCDVRLKKSTTNSVLSCPNCDYTEGQESDIQKGTSEEESKSDFLVLDENEGKDTMPTIEIECEKCGNNKAVWWMLQTRSADEPTTQFFRCTKCEYTWRNYA